MMIPIKQHLRLTTLDTLSWTGAGGLPPDSHRGFVTEGTPSGEGNHVVLSPAISNDLNGDK